MVSISEPSDMEGKMEKNHTSDGETSQPPDASMEKKKHSSPMHPEKSPYFQMLCLLT